MNWFYRVGVLVCFTSSIFATEPQWRFRPVEPSFIQSAESDNATISLGEDGSAVSVASFGGNQLVISQLGDSPTSVPLNFSVTGDTGNGLRTLGFAIGELIYSSDGAMLIDKNGKILWERNGEVEFPVAINGDRVVFSSASSVVCIDLLTGNAIWTRNLEAERTQITGFGSEGIAVDETGIYFSVGLRYEVTDEYYPTLIKLDLETGATIWENLGNNQWLDIGELQLSGDSIYRILTKSDNSGLKSVDIYSKSTGNLTNLITLGVARDAELFGVASGKVIVKLSSDSFPIQTDLISIQDNTLAWRKNSTSIYGFDEIIGVNESEFVAIESSDWISPSSRPAKIEKRSVFTGELIWDSPVFNGYLYDRIALKKLGATLRVASDYWVADEFGNPTSQGFIIQDINLSNGSAISTRLVPQKRATQPAAVYATNSNLLIGAAVDEISNKLVVKAVDKQSGVQRWKTEWNVPAGTKVPAVAGGSSSAIAITEFNVTVAEVHGESESYATLLDISSGFIKYKSDRSFSNFMPIGAGIFGSLHLIKPCALCKFESRYIDRAGLVKWATDKYPSVTGLNGSLFFLSENQTQGVFNSILALAEETGATLWQANLAGVSILASQAVDERLYVIGHPGHLLRLNPNTGAIVWSQIFTPENPQSRISYIRGLPNDRITLRLRSGSPVNLNTIMHLNALSGAVETQHAFSNESSGLRIGPISNSPLEAYYQSVRPYIQSDSSPSTNRNSLGIISASALEGTPIGENLLIGQRPLDYQLGFLGRFVFDADSSSVFLLRQDGVEEQDPGVYSFGDVIEKYALQTGLATGDLLLRVISQGFNVATGIGETILEVENVSSSPAFRIRLFSVGFSFTDLIKTCDGMVFGCAGGVPKTAEAFFDLAPNGKIRFSVTNQRIQYAIEPSYEYRDTVQSNNQVDTFDTSLRSGFE